MRQKPNLPPSHRVDPNHWGTIMMHLNLSNMPLILNIRWYCDFLHFYPFRITSLWWLNISKCSIFLYNGFFWRLRWWRGPGMSAALNTCVIQEQWWRRRLSCHTQRRRPLTTVACDGSVLCVPSPCLCVCTQRDPCPFSNSRAGICAILHSIVNILLIVFINNSRGQFHITSPCCGRTLLPSPLNFFRPSYFHLFFIFISFRAPSPIKFSTLYIFVCLSVPFAASRFTVTSQSVLHCPMTGWGRYSRSVTPRRLGWLIIQNACRCFCMLMFFHCHVVFEEMIMWKKKNSFTFLTIHRGALIHFVGFTVKHLLQNICLTQHRTNTVSAFTVIKYDSGGCFFFVINKVASQVFLI